MSCASEWPGGSDHALFELAGWLARRLRVDELRELFAGRLELLVNWLAGPCDVGDMRLVRLSAELGDEVARRRLERWLTQLRERADAGDEHARGFLAENPDWQQFLAEWAG